mmetsp:Transcript_1176/g.1076  ORF Transcript_1176/g.1076 Transcript_1176/m.1076 type:complete len:91 (-) Transcript_1176:482-754(-)
MKKIVKKAVNPIAQDSSFTSLRSLNNSINFTMKMEKENQPKSRNYLVDIKEGSDLTFSFKAFNEGPEDALAMPKNFNKESISFQMGSDTL